MANAGEQGSSISKVMTLMRGINEKDAELALAPVNREKFRSHNHRATGGAQGLAEFIGHVPAGGWIRVVRVFEDGEYVVTHSEADLIGHMALLDIFRFEDGEMVEHWDNLGAWAEPNASGHTPVDGPVAVEDRELTEGNKALVRAFYEAVFLRGEVGRLREFFDGERFIRHDARGGDGVAALEALLAEPGAGVRVDRIVMVLGEGNFVLVAAEGSMAGKATAFFDLFRVAAGKIAEHWGTIEEIPPAEQWRNGNGKF